MVKLIDMEGKAEEKGDEAIDEFIVVNEKGDLQEMDMEDLKNDAATPWPIKCTKPS